MKTGVARSTATGWITSIVPTPVPTPRPLRNPTKTDQMAPATADAPHSTSTSGSPPVTIRASTTGRAPLRRSPATTNGCPLAPQCPERVRAAGPARADGPRIRAAGEAGHEDPDRDRPREVGDEHQDQRLEHDRGIHRNAPPDWSGTRLDGTRERESSIARGPPRRRSVSDGHVALDERAEDAVRGHRRGERAYTRASALERQRVRDGSAASGPFVGCASRDAPRTIGRDDPPAQPTLDAGPEALRGTLTHGRRLFQ